MYACVKVRTHTYIHIHKLKCANRQCMNKHEHFKDSTFFYLYIDNMTLIVSENSLKAGVKIIGEEK